jgi:hypothetical protein
MHVCESRKPLTGNPHMQVFAGINRLHCRSLQRFTYEKKGSTPDE